MSAQKEAAGHCLMCSGAAGDTSGNSAHISTLSDALMHSKAFLEASFLVFWFVGQHIYVDDKIIFVTNLTACLLQ